MVVPVALVLIFLLLFSTFRSVLQAGLVLANIPLALIGGVLALWVSGHYMSVPASERRAVVLPAFAKVLEERTRKAASEEINAYVRGPDFVGGVGGRI